FFFFFFFFQAEDGIRDLTVTGVQTCALPIWIPAIWLFGGLDKQIPTRLSVQRLDPLLHDGTHDFEVAVFPNANHALVDTSTGLTSEMLRSDRFAPGLFARLAKWLRAHVTG